MTTELTTLLRDGARGTLGGPNKARLWELVTGSLLSGTVDELCAGLREAFPPGFELEVHTICNPGTCDSCDDAECDSYTGLAGRCRMTWPEMREIKAAGDLKLCDCGRVYRVKRCPTCKSRDEELDAADHELDSLRDMAEEVSAQ